MNKIGSQPNTRYNRAPLKGAKALGLSLLLAAGLFLSACGGTPTPVDSAQLPNLPGMRATATLVAQNPFNIKPTVTAQSTPIASTGFKAEIERLNNIPIGTCVKSGDPLLIPEIKAHLSKTDPNWIGKQGRTTVGLYRFDPDGNVISASMSRVQSESLDAVPLASHTVVDLFRNEKISQPSFSTPGGSELCAIDGTGDFNLLSTPGFSIMGVTPGSKSQSILDKLSPLKLGTGELHAGEIVTAVLKTEEVTGTVILSDNGVSDKESTTLIFLPKGACEGNSSTPILGESGKVEAVLTQGLTNLDVNSSFCTSRSDLCHQIIDTTNALNSPGCSTFIAASTWLQVVQDAATKPGVDATQPFNLNDCLRDARTSEQTQICIKRDSGLPVTP